MSEKNESIGILLVMVAGIITWQGLTNYNQVQALEEKIKIYQEREEITHQMIDKLRNF